jgi:hypothetical protein
MKMRSAVALLGLAVGVVGCDAPLSAVLGILPRRVGPSPLAGADPERIHAILYFSQAYLPECGRYFASPTDPRYVQFGLKCEANELNMVDWLRANGFPTVQPEHLRAAEFWESRARLEKQIDACRKVIFDGPGELLEKSTKAAPCDPINRLPTDSTGIPSVQSAGIRVPAY